MEIHQMKGELKNLQEVIKNTFEDDLIQTLTT